jgi:formylglycine-generating enzyme required for sulfatase activity
MGADRGKRDQKPAHEVTIERNFAIGKFEITFDQWDACQSEGACPDVTSDEGWGRERRPVINVSWDDARQYVRWLSRRTGQAYSLPAEAQWEYAARANAKTAYAWGDSVGDNRANCKKCGSEWGGKQTASVGSFAPNGFGLHDVHGNVWEWVEDCWHSSYRKAPNDGSAWTTGSCTMSDGMGSRSDFGFRVVRNIPQ